MSKEQKKCEPNGISYLSIPQQSRCKNCHQFWFTEEPVPNCKWVEINTIFPSTPTESTTICKCVYLGEGNINCEHCRIHNPSPTKPDTNPCKSEQKDFTRNDPEEWEKELSRKFFEGELSWNGSKCLISIPPLIEFIRQEKEKSHLEGYKNGYKQGEFDSEMEIQSCRHSAYSEIIEIVEGMYADKCDCVGEKYACEHWGRHELISEIRLKLKERLNNK
jgi:hypothetical protein